VAEREGFEPSIRFCRILTFQASAFDHSATAPAAPERVHNSRIALEERSFKKAGAKEQPCRLGLPAPMRTRMRRFGTPPSADEIEAIARRTLQALPEPFSNSLDDVVLLVEEFADDATLDAMGIKDPFDLSGIYEGVPLPERSVGESGTLPERIRLFRRPILDEWAAGPDTLEHLVAHVLIHEVGHHFGLSDQDMHALEDQVA
jgi:predicted Zn-dependent protease with MMP-like domain